MLKNLAHPELGYTPSNLKRLRKHYKLTRRRLAKAANTSFAMIPRWEASVLLSYSFSMPHKKWVWLLERGLQQECGIPITPEEIEAVLSPAELGYTPNNLRALREQYGLTQFQVSQLLDCSFRTVARWEARAGSKQQSDMSHMMWLRLLSALEGR